MVYSIQNYQNYRVQDESLRWLTVNGKTREIEKVLKKVAKWNKSNVTELKENVQRKMKALKVNDIEETQLEKGQGETTLKVEKYSILTILQNKSVLLISVLLCFTW